MPLLHHQYSTGTLMSRDMLRKQRQAISSQKKASDEILLLEQFKRAFPTIKQLNIASYKPSWEEISPLKIDSYLSNDNTLHYPIIHPYRARHLWFAEDTQKWRHNRFGLLEPIINIKNIIAPWELDLVITPLVGFDRHKNRLGMGGGFYDSSFAFLTHKEIFPKKPLMVGIAFDEQALDYIEIRPWDIKMDIIITPSQILK
ncbi:5-formyltetrahydrofolate cyclo-ligase [Fangia hongkongensis]|uniref:5-formyltetrahydrofolate cyclo-ligase n=2 Tax=Fangia hongkongensis TaxID=270495 RepID=UPI00039A0300|nr:5-formyltetrahydrofolate cyclo-ligase [Fangia hongkongensis]MBK2124300.1 5-formyltetrahydrofolate cyclo-ligase [Fangia hongkongensis]